MYTCEEILGTHSAVLDFTDVYQRDLHDITVSLERICRECSVDQIRQLNSEIAEVKKWINELDRKVE